MAAIGAHIHERGGLLREMRVGLAALVVAFVIAFVLEGAWFAGHQQIWIDESTQLSGAMLSPPGRMLAWLAGRPEPSLGVPADRMPPLSYLIDALCLQVFGLGAVGLRLLHLAIATAGMATLVGALGRRHGLAVSGVAALLFALSPKIVEASVELRAYPIFLAITCAQVVLLLRLVDGRASVAGLIAFTLAGIAAIYTHFFGLVSSSAFFLALGLARLRDRRGLAGVVLAYVMLLAASIGILPFVAGSTALSAGTGDHAATGPSDLALFLLRLVGHPATMVQPIAAASFLGGFAALLVITLAATARSVVAAPASALGDHRFLLLGAIAAGLTVTLAAAAVARGFNPLKPSYSLWTYPVLVTLASLAVTRDRRLGMPAAALFAFGGFWSTILFLAHTSWFAHGPERAVSAAVGPRPAGVAIVYAGPNWAYSYYPLNYLYRGHLHQWLLGAGGRLHRIAGGGEIDPAGVSVARLADVRTIILARIPLDTYADLRRIDPSKPIERPAPLPGFTAVAHTVEPGLYAIDLARYVKKDRP